MAEEKRRGWCRRLLLGKPGTRWWRRGPRLLVAVVVLLFLAIAGLYPFRKPWIEPIPGVRIEMTRPHVKASDLGPDSAYKLFREALIKIARADLTVPNRPARSCSMSILEWMGEKVVYPAPYRPTGEEGLSAVEEDVTPRDPPLVWGSGWSDAMTKLVHHPWPRNPPPPAPRPRPAVEMEDGVDAWLAAIEAPPPDPRGKAIARTAPWILEQYREIPAAGVGPWTRMPLLDRALAAPNPQVPTTVSLMALNTHCQAVRELGRWLIISAHVKATSGDYQGAYRDLRRSVGAGSLTTRGGSWVDHLTSWANAFAAAQAVRVIALRYDVPPAVLREAARDSLASANGVAPFVELVRADFVPLLNFMPAYYSHAHFDINGYPGSSYWNPRNRGEPWRRHPEGEL